MTEEHYLNPANQKVAGEFVNSLIWHDMKRCLLLRRTEAADVKDEPHVAAAKGHKRAAWDEMIAAIEKLPFEHDETPKSPFTGPLFDQRD